MGYAMVIGACFVCRVPFAFNPRKVPAMDGVPICKGCMEIVNAKRKELGYEPHPVAPDAYDAVPEEEI